MYICIECQEQFKNKPEYCTCGNDEFKYVSDGGEKSESLKPKKEFEAENSAFLKVLPIAIFSLCLILSILVWFINPKQETQKVSSSQTEIVKNIPDIDSIWVDAIPKKNDTILKNIETKPVKKEQVLTPSNQVKASQNPKVTNNKSQAKKDQTQKINKPKTLPVETPKKTETKPVVLPQSIVDTVKTSDKQVVKENTKQSDNVVEKTNVTTQTQVSQKPPEPPKMNENEFLNYKGAIRSALLAKLDVVAIKGSGDCAIEFSVDNSGKLINRNFIYKSSNKTINDEVYKMLMRLPYYNQPPKYYSGEKIKLKFMFNNGYYEITFM